MQIFSVIQEEMLQLPSFVLPGFGSVEDLVCMFRMFPSEFEPATSVGGGGGQKTIESDLYHHHSFSYCRDVGCDTDISAPHPHLLHAPPPQQDKFWIRGGQIWSSLPLLAFVSLIADRPPRVLKRSWWMPVIGVNAPPPPNHPHLFAKDLNGFVGQTWRVESEVKETTAAALREKKLRVQVLALEVRRSLSRVEMTEA